MVRPRVFMDFAVDNVPVGRVIFELFNDVCPKTCENFRALCTGEKGLSPLSDRPLYYKNSIIHRSIADFMIQGGDFTKRNGTGGESIYGGPFPDEDLTHPLDTEGLLCMANKGPNTNGSQFFVTLRDCSHLKGKHTVFGKVIRGYNDVIEKIAAVPVDDKDRPTVPVTVANCGELELRKPANAPQATAQISNGESEGEKDRHRHKRRSRSADSEDDRKHRKKHKQKKHKHRSKERVKSANRSDPDEDKGEKKETEEEYDARLEREENERLEATRRQELERIAKLAQKEVEATNGVRFKGRGRMKYVDPELHQGHR
ncbi:hypothetical protein BV25DRAFT_1993727 [Artomyces pyxidatus]|uniref:Uncharacterized protein n=1 Tax=Artomyces pyxidatus TaxID=48021 RepID=A0ACB8SRI3_9AGAM|nr:hypothetical protein BV25DRAFT_1993727 [Artomyces pyxidatus]